MRRIRSVVAVVILTASPMVATAQESSGSAAIQSSEAGRKMSWQNWVFAGTALVAAAIGITFIALNQGSHAH